MKLIKPVFFYVIIVLCFTNTQCDDDDNLPSYSCEQLVIIDEEYYSTIESTEFSILFIEVGQDCLLIDLSASGCDGNSWDYKLVDSGVVVESSPEQRFLKLELINNETCLAIISKHITFNLELLKIEGVNEVLLNIEGYNQAILYTY